MTGKIIPAQTLILHERVGAAKSSGGREYEISLSMNRTPLIRSTKSRQWWSLSWEEMLDMAIEKGIDITPKPKKPKPSKRKAPRRKPK